MEGESELQGISWHGTLSCIFIWSYIFILYISVFDGSEGYQLWRHYEHYYLMFLDALNTQLNTAILSGDWAIQLVLCFLDRDLLLGAFVGAGSMRVLDILRLSVSPQVGESEESLFLVLSF